MKMIIFMLLVGLLGTMTHSRLLEGDFDEAGDLTELRRKSDEPLADEVETLLISKDNALNDPWAVDKGGYVGVGGTSNGGNGGRRGSNRGDTRGNRGPPGGDGGPPGGGGVPPRGGGGGPPRGGGGGSGGRRKSKGNAGSRANFEDFRSVVRRRSYGGRLAGLEDDGVLNEREADPSLKGKGKPKGQKCGNGKTGKAGKTSRRI